MKTLLHCRIPLNRQGFSKEKHLNALPKGVKNGRNNTRDTEKSAANIKELLFFTLFSILSTLNVRAAPIAVHTHGLMALQRYILCHHWHIPLAHTSLSAVLAHTLSFTQLLFFREPTPHYCAHLCIQHRPFWLHTFPAQLLELPLPGAVWNASSSSKKRCFSPWIWVHSGKKKERDHTFCCQMKDRGAGMTDRLRS